MDSILSTISAKTSAKTGMFPSPEEVPDSPLPTEKFDTFMERTHGGTFQSLFSGKAKSSPIPSASAKSHKDAGHQKGGSAKTTDSKNAHRHGHPATASMAGSTSHTAASSVPTPNPASPTIEVSDSSLMTASAAAANPAAASLSAKASAKSAAATTAPAAAVPGKTLLRAGSRETAQKYLPATDFQNPAIPVNGKADLHPQTGSKNNSTATSSTADVADAVGSPTGPETKSAGKTASASTGTASNQPNSGTIAKPSIPPLALQQALTPANTAENASKQNDLKVSNLSEPVAEETAASPELPAAQSKSVHLVAPAVSKTTAVDLNSVATITQPGKELSATATVPGLARSNPTTGAQIASPEPKLSAPVPGTIQPSFGGVQLSTEPATHPSQTTPVEPNVPQATPNGPTHAAAQNGKSAAENSQATQGMTADKTAHLKTNPALPGAASIPGAGRNSSPAPPTAASRTAVAAEIAGANSAGKNPPANATLQNQGNLTASQPVPSAQLARGTAVAQQETPMNMAAKQNKFAGAVDQKLPGSFSALGKPVSPAPSGGGTAPLAGQPQDSAAPAMSATAVSSNASATAGSSNVSDASSILSSPLQTVQRTQDLMAMHIVQMHEAGTDSLRVVIKPDTGLQLSLQLQQHADGIDVQARVDHGDYHLLNQHWAELQQQFELRGIRVAPLSNSGFFSGGGSEGFHQSSKTYGQLSEEEAAPTPTRALASGYPPSAIAISASTSTTLSRRWESWA